MTRRPTHDISCRGHDHVFRERKPNPKLTFMLMLDGKQLARAGSKKEINDYCRAHRITGYTIEVEQ